MTIAPRMGNYWTQVTGSGRSRAKALFVALPLLLMLSLMSVHGGAGQAGHRSGAADAAGQASDMLGAESKAQLASRAWVLGADQLRAKPKLSGDGLGAHGLTPAAVLVTIQAASPAAASAAHAASGRSLPLAARPRAPPAAA